MFANPRYNHQENTRDIVTMQRRYTVTRLANGHYDIWGVGRNLPANMEFGRNRIDVLYQQAEIK